MTKHTQPLTKWTQIDSAGIYLNDDDGGRILTISKDEGGLITFGEACDYFSVSMPKEDAKQALREALAWLEG